MRVTGPYRRRRPSTGAKTYRVVLYWSGSGGAEREDCGHDHRTTQGARECARERLAEWVLRPADAHKLPQSLGYTIVEVE
jgi:hypothetical protein